MSDRFGGVPVDEDKFGGIAVAEPPEPTAQPSAPVPESTVREWLGDEGFPVPRTPEELGQQTFRRQQQLFGAVPPQPGEQETRPPLSTALELIGKGAVAIADLPSTIRNKLYPGLDPLPSIADLPRPQIPRVSPEEVSPTEPAAQTIAGLYNLAAGTVQELLPPFARPEVGLTLPLLGEGGMIAKVAAGLFGIEQLQAMPEEVREAIRVVKDPNSTLAQKVEAVGRPPVSGALATMMLKAPFKDTSGFAPAEREADARMRGISPVIADVQAREAASPAFAQWISQLTPEELRARGLPPGAVTFTAPGPLPSEEQIMAPQRATEAEAEAARVAQVRKFAEQVQGLAKPPRATVPGTPPEQRTTIAEEIRVAKADTVEKIRALFEPVTGPMKKSVARAWGREAWGQDWPKKPTPTAPKPPEPIPTAPAEAFAKELGLEFKIQKGQVPGMPNYWLFTLKGTKEKAEGTTIMVPEGTPVEDIRKRWEAAAKSATPPKPTAPTFTVSTPKKEHTVSGVWDVVEGKDIVRSDRPGYDPILQARTAGGSALDERAAEIASAPNYERLGQSQISSQGAPFLNPANHILSGNARDRAIEMLYQSGRGDAYRQWVLDTAKKLGFTPEQLAAFEKMKEPRLVRRVTDYGGMKSFGDQAQYEFARLSNISDVNSLRAAEQAKSDAIALTTQPGLVDLFLPSETGDVLAASNQEFLRRFFDAIGRPGDLKTAEGWNAPAMSGRVKNAMLALVLDVNDQRNAVLVRTMIESPESIGKHLVTGIMQATPKLIGLRSTTYDISKPLADALRRIADVKSRGESIEEYLDQRTMFGDPSASAESTLLLQFLGRVKSAKDATERLMAYVNSANDALKLAKEGDLLGQKPLTRTEILANLRALYEKKPPIQPELPKPPTQPPTEPPTPPGQPVPPKPKVPPPGETPVGQKPKHFDDTGRDEAINRLKQKKPPQPPKSAAALDEVAAREYRSESDVQGAEPADAPERIVGAAVKFPNGNIYSAPLHYQALHKAWPAGESIEAVYEDGFITSKGRFVDRTAAYTIAMRAKQMPESADYPRLESHTFQSEQKKRIREQGAAPEEEGLQGARARKELFPEPPAEDPLYEGQTLSDLTHIGGNLVESGIISYPEWHKAMTETVGPEFQHYFRRAYNQVRDTSELRAMTKTMTPRDEVETYNDAGVKVGAGSKHRPGLRWIDEDATPIPDIFIKQGDFIGPEGDYLDQTQRLAINLALTARAKGKQAILIADGPGVGKSGTGAAIGHLITKLSNKKVLIVGVNESQIETGFKPDFEKLGIPLDNIEFITYKLLEDEGGAPTSERGKQYARILATDYGAVIFDEAHSLKNAASNREHNSRKIKADFRVLMTATPMDNTANAIYFLSHITGKAPRQVMDELGLKIVEKMKGGELREFVVQKEGISHEDVSKATRKMREKAVADGTMIRREFPFFGEAKEHTGQRLTPEQLKQQQAIYDFWQEKIDRATFPTARMNYAGQRTHELARWSESMKGPEILKMIEDELAAGRSVVVYGNHINESLIKGLFEYNGDKPFMAPGILGWLSEELKKKNIEFAQIFGPVKDTKQQSIRAFYRNRVRVALVTPKSGGAGLNLDDVVGRYPRTLLTASMTWEGDIFEQLVYRVSRRNTASASKALFHMTPDAFADMRKRSGMDRKLNILRGMQAGEDTDLKTFIDDLNNPAEGPKLQGAAAEDWGGGHEKFQGAIEAGYDSGPKYSGLPYEYLADEIATQEALGNKVAADQLRSEKLRRDELDERAQAILDQDPDFLRYSELLETMPLDHPQRLDWERNRDKIVASVAQQVERTPPEPQGATAPPTVVPPSVAPAANKLPPKPLWQIVRDLKDGIAQPIVYSLRYSRFGGIFDPVRKYIRIKKPGDFPVVPHEVGHSIDNVFALSSMPALVPELDTLGDPSRPGSRSSWKPGKTVTYKMGEGAAEFMRLWITDPAEATRIAPNIERVWNAILDANPELEFMRTAREDYQVWKKSPAEARFESRISRGSNPLKVKWGVGNLVADGIDDLHFINQMVFDAISGGQPLRSGKDPYILFRNLRGSYGRAEIFLLKGTTDALTLDVTPGLSLLSVLRMVSGETNEWSRWLLAKNADMMRRQGKDPGIPPDEISAVLQAHNGKRNFHDAFNRLQQWNDSLLKYSVDLGYLTLKDLALMKKANEFYVPMHRLYEVAAGEPLVGGAGRGRAPAVIGRPGALRRRGGSDRPIIDPIEVLMRNAYEIVYAAEKNQALTALVDLSTRPGMGKWIRPEPMVQEPVKFDIARIREQLIGLGIDPKDIPDHALLEYWRETRSPRLPDNMIRVKRNGKWEYYQLEPNLYKAVQASDQFMMSNLWRWMAFPSQVLRAGVTGDPAFALWRNVLRDTVSASVISRYTILPFESSLRGAYNLLAPNIAELLGFKNHAELLEATVNEWKASGGKHSVESAYFDRDALIKFMQHAMTHDLSFAQRGLYLMKTPLMGLRLLSQIGEESTRIGEYKKVFDAEIAKGASRRGAHLTAAFEARDLQDFAMQGAKIKAIKLLTAFWNASLQGRYRFYRSWYDPRHPGIWQSTLLKGVGFITAAKMLEQYVNWDNDDYWNQPRWQRLMFFHFPIMRDSRGHSRFLLVPVPFEAGVIFASFPGAMMEYIKKRDPGIAKVFGQQFLYQTFDSPLPQFTTTLFEINAGEQGWDTFTSHPIVPTGETRQPYWARYTDQSSIVARRVGKMLNVAPAKIEHLIRRTTGGVGSQLVHQGVDKVLSSTLGDKPAPLPATPFTSFVTTPAGARSQVLDDFYAKLKVLELEKYSRDHLNKSDPEIELSDYPGMIAAQKQISDLRRQTFGELDADKRQRITLQMQAIAKPYVRTQTGKWKGWIIRRQQYP